MTKMSREIRFFLQKGEEPLKIWKKQVRGQRKNVRKTAGSMKNDERKKWLNVRFCLPIIRLTSEAFSAGKGVVCNGREYHAFCILSQDRLAGSGDPWIILYRCGSFGHDNSSFFKFIVTIHILSGRFLIRSQKHADDEK